MPLNGTLYSHTDLPGDKSISHRALIFAALAHSPSRLYGLNGGEDVRCTRQALQSIGVNWSCHDHIVECSGRPAQWLSPVSPVDLGNSGTSARLLTGLMAALPLNVTLTGDASLSNRPMHRVIDPLSQMGAHIISRQEQLPLTIHGRPLTPFHHHLTVPSAQIKSALLLAGMETPGMTMIQGAIHSRDHTERMMDFFGLPLQRQNDVLTITGPTSFAGQDISIPADPSAAAFFAVAALITPDSHIKMTGISWNSYRHQVFLILQQMGGNIRVSNHRTQCGEPVADIEVFSSSLSGIQTVAHQTPGLIDEFPIMSIAAACAQGPSVFRGLAELRVKESNRLHAIAYNLQKLGYQTRIESDDLHIMGQSSQNRHDTGIKTFHDHRIAMSFAILNLVYPGHISLDDEKMIQTSFPNFFTCLRKLQGQS